MANELGELLRSIRFKRGEVLYNMANKLHMRVSDLLKIERGALQPGLDFVSIVCEQYALTDAELNALRRLCN